MSFALVLGGGGATGWVFHAGVLDGLEHAGIDPRRAGVIVGTSAGAAVGAAVRSGVSGHEIVESAARPPSPEDRAEMLAEVRATKKTLRPLAPGLLRHVLPGGNGPAVAAAGLMPPGIFPTRFLQRFPGVVDHETWPDGLWIPAVRADTGRVVVFGLDRTDVPVAAAIEASSAVPGMFRPKEIDGVRYVDGGLASPTHADLAALGPADRVVVSSPMTRRSRRPMSRLARRRLDAEVQMLRSAGVDVVVVEPTPEVAAAARGFPRRNPGAAPEIVDAARRETVAALERGFS